MSAPGSSAPPGPAGPPGYRRPPKSNPLVVRRKGVRVPDRKQPPPPTAPIPPGALPTEAPKKTIHAEDEPEPTGPYRDIPVVLTKKMIIDGLRFHALKLQAENSADITDPEQWPRPVRLHRRDPRAAPTDESAPPPEPVIKTTTPEEDKEREKLEALKAERKRIRDENQAQIAPSAKQQQQPAKTLQFKRKFEQVFLAADTVEGRAKSQIKYEESLPWHLEDDDGKNIWKGSYVSELSKRNAMLVFEGGASAGSNQIRIVMVEKWYRFQERTKFRPLEYEEAEAQMNQKFKNPKWMVEIEKQQAESAERERNAQALSRVVKVKGGGATSGEFGNIDDVDFDEREIFDDDDEGGHLLGHDEDEAKEAENRIRQGQYSFNAFGEQETNGKGDGGPTKKELELKQLEKKMRRKLAKKDVNYLLSDDDSDPYASSSSEDSDEEAANPTDEAKGKESADQKAADSGAASPAGTNTTISGTQQSAAATATSSKRGGSNLKRPGSPTLSEASDLDTVRKRVKKNPKSAAKVKVESDNDAATTTAASKASAPAGSKKSKLNAGPRSPPAPTATATATREPSSTPVPTPASNGNLSDSDDGDDFFGDGPVIVTLDKIRSAIPADGKGISLKRLLKRFRRMDKSTTEFVGLLKKVSQFDKSTRRIYPLKQ